MVVLQINVVCGHGSTGKIAVDIAELLTSKGDKAFIAYGYGESNYPGSYRICSDSECRINAHIFDRLGLQGRGSVFGTMKFLKWVDTIHPDIIHLHNIHGSYIHYPLLFNYIKKHNIPVIWTIHDCWPVTGHCAHFVLANCSRWLNGCHNCTYKGAYKEKSLIENSASSFRTKQRLFTSVKQMRLIPVSKWMNDVIQKSFLNKYPSTVIYNGINLELFKYRESEVKKSFGLEGKFVVLGVSSQWDDVKGLSDFIKLAEKIPNNCKIVLVGVTSKQIAELPESVVGINRTKNQMELAELYSAADVTLSLSYAESMGLTIVESMACGTPVIVYDNTAQKESVAPDTGFVAKTGSINQVADFIKCMILKGRDYYSSFCIERAKEFFDMNEQYQEYYNVYQSVLNN